MVSTNSVIFVLLSVLISTVLYVDAQPRPTGNSTLYTTFTAQVSVYNDPAVLGRLSGTLYYGWKNTTKTTLKRIDYSIGPSDIFTWDDTTATRYTKCDGSCEAETSADRPEYLFVQTVDKPLGYTITLNGVTCFAYNRTNTTQQANSLIQLFAEANGKLCRVVYYSGKTMDFKQVSNVVAPENLVINPAWNCPVAKCDAMIDLIYLFDMSGSINDAQYEIARRFTYNLSDSFNIGSDAVRIGIIFFETVATVILPISNSKANVLQTVSTMARRNGGTQIARGLNAVRLNMPTSRNGVSVSKVMIIFTDAKPSDPALWYPAWKNLTDTGVISITVGVGSINRNNLWNMSSTIPGFQTFWTTPNYESLGNLLKNGFVAQACQPLPGIGYCGVDCKGYCSCNKQCLCPDDCDDNSVCTTDQCNVGQNGNGCRYTSITCDDDNKCTDKFCDPTGGCYFVNKTVSSYCNDGIKCTNDICVPSIGCQSIQKDCKDDDVCTQDFCDESTGECKNIMNYECVCSRKTCPFLNNCTQNICDNTDGVCKPVSINCNDNNFCTDDSCNNATGCVYSPHDCSDGSLCTFDQCDSKAGVCVNPTIVCDDGDICTDNNCIASTGCVYPPKPKSYCDDGLPCTNDTCVSPSIGCINTPITCNDNNICTIDKCNNGTNANSYTCSNQIVGSCLCESKICPNIASCIVNQCNNDNGECETSPKKCDDGNICTVDSCNNSTISGCVYTPKNCSDNNACTIDTCDSKVPGGCVYSNVTCDDLDICTDDSCSASIGCIFTNKSASFCDDGIKCTIDTCVHGGVGCLNKPIDCNDNDVCTADSCDENTGTCLNVMNFECLCARTTCPFIDNCTLSYCNTTDGTCDQAPVNCDDNNVCTDDFCNINSGCYYQVHVCDDVNACTVDTCDRNVAGGCVYTELNATTYDDLNACTRDFCDNSTGVHHVNITCDDNSACTYDTCQSISGCVFVDKDCGDILGAGALESKCSFAMCNSSDSTGFGCYVGISPNAEFDECGDCFGKGLNCVSKVTIGIGAGIIAAITIGSLAVVGAVLAGSYGGVKAYQKYRTTMDAAHNNPLFVEKQQMGDNPLYSEDSGFELDGK